MNTPPSTPAAPVAATPRTDAAQYDSQPGHPLVPSGCFVVPADFARQLERDLAARDAELGALHGRIGRFAAKWWFLSDNLPTDETFTQIEEQLDDNANKYFLLMGQLQTATERAARAEQELAAYRAAKEDAP